MRVFHHDRWVELPDEWWVSAGMSGFAVSSLAYRYAPDAAGRRVCLIRIVDIEPARRGPGVAVFNDDIEEGIAAKERVQRILRGFLENAELPPVELSKQAGPIPYPFRLNHGVHRLYCSLAAGYTHVPAVKFLDSAVLDEGRDIAELC
jgi:hypothetical protein